MCPRRKITFHHIQGLDVEHGIEFTIDSMEMWNPMLTLAEIHLDNDAVKPGDNRHA